MAKMNNDKMTLVKGILLTLLDVPLEMYKIFESPRRWQREYPRPKKQVIYNTINRLKTEGYLEEVEYRGRKRYRTTLKGKAKILAYLKKDKKWDGKWRIVIFDVPEEKKKMRNFFREKLGELGFCQLQKSVWICPYNTANVVEELIELCQAKSYVHYLLVEELDNKAILMKLFKLSGEK